MPCCRHSSGTGVPPSACFNTAMIWLSLNRDFFMEPPRVRLRENSTSGFNYFPGGLPYVGVLMPAWRQTSFTGTPASACLRIETIWVSVNFDFFIKPPGWETMPESSTSVLSTDQGSLRFQGSLSNREIVHNNPDLAPERDWSTDLDLIRFLTRGQWRISLYQDRFVDTLYKQTDTPILMREVPRGLDACRRQRSHRRGR